MSRSKFLAFSMPAFAIILVLAACGLDSLTGKKDKKKDTPAPTDTLRRNEDAFNDAVTYENIKLELKDGAALEGDQVEIFTQVNDGKPTSRRKITGVLVMHHVNYYNVQKDVEKTSVDDITQKLGDLRSAVGATSDQHDAKVSYEGKLKEVTGGKDILYNVTAVSLGHIFKKAQLQCYSATSLHLVVLREKAFYFDGNPVVIFESGHVLPGYMVRDGSDWKLVGIETTLLGKARIEYGKAKDLKGIRVVDGELFALAEAFKGQLKNEADVVKNMLQQTAKKYGIPLAENDGLGNMTIASGSSNGDASSLLNATPFGFGSVQMIDAPKRRVSADSMEANKGRGENGTASFSADVSTTFCVPGSHWQEVPELKGCRNPATGIVYSQPIPAVFKDRGNSQHYEVDGAVWNANSYCGNKHKVGGATWAPFYPQLVVPPVSGGPSGYGGDSQAGGRDIYQNVNGVLGKNLVYEDGFYIFYFGPAGNRKEAYVGGASGSSEIPPPVERIVVLCQLSR